MATGDGFAATKGGYGGTEFEGDCVALKCGCWLLKVATGDEYGCTSSEVDCTVTESG